MKRMERSSSLNAYDSILYSISCAHEMAVMIDMVSVSVIVSVMALLTAIVMWVVTEMFAIDSFLRIGCSTPSSSMSVVGAHHRY